MHRIADGLALGIAGLALLSLAPAAHAEANPTFEITPFAGYRFGGQFDTTNPDTGDQKSMDLKDGASYGIDLGLYRDANAFYELLYSRQQTNLDTNDPALRGVDVTVEYLQFGGTAMFPQDRQWFVPYLSFTLGATRIAADDGDSDSTTRFSGSLGGGFRMPFSDNFAANLGLRGYLTAIQSDTDFLCVSGSEGGTCLLKSSGSTFFQVEATLGVSMRF
jgi:opacity protein-like surface antigen